MAAEKNYTWALNTGNAWHQLTLGSWSRDKDKVQKLVDSWNKELEESGKPRSYDVYEITVEKV